MTHDARRIHFVKTVEEQPFECPSELRDELDVLFAPMERSIASSVCSAINVHSRRTRSLQAFWLGLSPVLAVALVAVLYVSGIGFLPASTHVGSRTLATASNAEIRTADPAAKGMLVPGFLASPLTSCAQKVLNVNVQSDPIQRGVLVSWLRAGHPDVAAQLETAEPGAGVTVKLEAGEVHSFVSVMVLHGFTGQSPSGLHLSVQSSSEAWMSALRAASNTVCLVP